MAEAASITVAVAKLLFVLSSRIKSNPTHFRHLHQDLKSFHNALLLAEEYLPRLDDVRVACEELVADISGLIEARTSGNLFRRMKMAFENPLPLSDRLTRQISMLHASVT